MHTNMMRMATCAAAKQSGRPFALDLTLSPPAWPDLLTATRLRRIVADMVD
ncbi:hypothetical protein WSK_2162 [Novosphingobium sp. Rr 2-17]|nr:hypothetical protein WSK_2162 [Novosphingobium sp. Rr 2-17]